MPVVGAKYPMMLYNGNMEVIVHDDEEYKEAQGHGFAELHPQPVAVASIPKGGAPAASTQPPQPKPAPAPPPPPKQEVEEDPLAAAAPKKATVTVEKKVTVTPPPKPAPKK